MSDARPEDCAGWKGLSAELKSYERSRAAHLCGGHVTRPADVAALEALLREPGAR